MTVLMNTWVEKQKKKRAPETAPAFASAPGDDWLPTKNSTSAKRYSTAARSTMRKTLRGVRK